MFQTVWKILKMGGSRPRLGGLDWWFRGQRDSPQNPDHHRGTLKIVISFLKGILKTRTHISCQVIVDLDWVACFVYPLQEPGGQIFKPPIQTTLLLRLAISSPGPQEARLGPPVERLGFWYQPVCSFLFFGSLTYLKYFI